MNRGRGGRRGRRGAAQQLASYKREAHGHTNRLRNLGPPSINLRPFNTMCVHLPINTSGSPGSQVDITVVDITKRILNQLGLVTQDAAILVFKIQRMDVYCVAAPDTTTFPDRPSVNALCSSLVPQLANNVTGVNPVHYPIIKQLSDQGTITESARVSYSWPLSMRDTPLSNLSNFVVTVLSGNQKFIDVFYHVQWSTTDVSPTVA